MVRRDIQPDRPTIGDLRMLGMKGLTVTCANGVCGHAAGLTFEQIGMPDSESFVDLPRCRRFRCAKCGGHQIEVSPNWSCEHPEGIGFAVLNGLNT